MEIFNEFVVDIEITIVLNKKRDNLECMRKNMKTEGFFMWLFYTTDLPGVVFHVLEKELSVMDERPVCKMKVKYIVPNGCTEKELKDKVQGIFNHWFLSSDITYILEKFQVLSSLPNRQYARISCDTYINLL